jgi:hypothetical protein
LSGNTLFVPVPQSLGIAMNIEINKVGLVNFDKLFYVSDSEEGGMEGEGGRERRRKEKGRRKFRLKT